MIKYVIGLILICSSMFGQTLMWSENRISEISHEPQRAVGDNIRSTGATLSHLAMGGTWETVLNVINLNETTPSKTEIQFFDPSGKRMEVSFRQAGTNNVATGTVILVTLPPRGTMDLVSVQSNNLRVGWAKFDHVSKYTDTTFGGESTVQLVFRETVPNAPQKEAVVLPDWSLDKKIVTQYNNTNGFVSSIALCNSSSYSDLSLIITISDENGNILVTKYETLKIGNQIAFETTNRWPETRNRKGTIIVTSSNYGLGSLVLLFNPTGSLTSSQFYGID